jgi:hypothetical protein
MTTPKVLLLVLINLAAFTNTLCQTLTQTVRGTIVDKISKVPLPGASVVVVNSNPFVGATTDEAGNFKLSNVLVGTQTLKITFIGYLELAIPNIVVNSGKEVVLNIPLEENIIQMDAVVIEETIDKNKPLNDMAVVSARTFSVEETRKYAAAVNDPARMVASYAGVVQTSDGSNSISIRGNSPYGLTWRMEGVDIPNPNHFANVATSGGGISILSTQLLTNSDFITGAFPAEYGNALSGVFDLNLRKGNNEKHEYTIQAGFLGLDVAAEGPFAKNYKGSYLVNYRYSTLSILNKLGVNIGDGVTTFQDLSFNFHLPTKHFGNFSIFGFGGLSSDKFNAKKDSSLWKVEDDRYNNNFYSNTGAAGVRHSLSLSDKTYLQSAVVLSGNAQGDVTEKYVQDYALQFQYRERHANNKLTFSSVLNHKFNARHSIRSGVYFNEYYYNLSQRNRNSEKIMEEQLNAHGDASTVQLFSQWNFRMNEKLTFNSGVHYLCLNSNQTYSLEPRASVKYNVNEQQSISFGYGMHSQMQPMGIYHAQSLQPDGTYITPNANLKLNKAQHFVLAFDRALNQHLRVKAETYYQHLYNIPVKNDVTSSLAVSNNEDGYITDPLVNKGVGRNYGLELTLEQFMHNDLYFLLSTSLYDSKYKALDNIWRNSRYNGNYAISFTAGKEFKSASRKNRVFGINIRTLSSGGFRTTPIDIDRSIEDGETKRIESLAYTQQMPGYFRTDLRFSVKKNRLKSTSTLALDIQNVTNRQNLGGQYFDAQSGEIKKWYQLPLLPVLSYKVEF